jgi:DNA-binding CsgD family transcriptional regulator
MNSHIPAGLVDTSIEFFMANGELMVIENGITSPFMELTVNAATLLRDELDRNPIALKALEQMGIDNALEQLYQYAKCRYSDLNEVGDLKDGESHPEFWDCGQHGKCFYEGILCVPLRAPFGRLTNREIQIIKLISQDYPDKIIAKKLVLSIHTVRTHIKHIEDKIGAFTKVGVTCYACQNHIV